MNEKIGLFCGVVPMCDRCAEHDAKVNITLPTYGERALCEPCVITIMEKGLQHTWPEIKSTKDMGCKNCEVIVGANDSFCWNCGNPLFQGV